ncbi:hypothetical protein H4Q32_028438 [Labeo rohita]|uniref:Integrase catalytic domain-containing protein n=1 Tax=Labeo rohita TaxID=84645 RepID=A0ABQ8LBR2_LABRO|nr:hypothetical protein H4Q32_028438 [Labeo rohita]
MRSCSCCPADQKSPAGVPLHAWRWPCRPWQRIHIDFTEKDKHFFLVVIDSHSKWFFVIDNRLNSQLTLSKACLQIMRYQKRWPKLASVEFTDFLKGNGIKQVPAFHPASNGAEERSVQTRKTPVELFLKRQIRTRFSLLKPDLTKGQKKWLRATVIERKGPVSYLVQEGHRRRTVHADHMLSRNAASGSPMHGVLEIPNSSVTDDNSGPQILEPKSPENTENLTAQDPGCATPAVETVRRYPQSIRTAPKRLDL